MESLLLYYSVFISHILLISSVKRKGTIISKFYFFLGLLVIISFVSYRYKVGTDFVNYINGYYIASGKYSIRDLLFSQEFGFKLLSKLCFYLQSVKVFLGVISFITLICIYKGVRKITKFWLLPYGIYLFLFFPNTLNLMRQGLAQSILFYATTILITERSIKKYFLYTILATTIHTTAFLGIIVLFIYKLSLNFKKYFIFIVIGVVIICCIVLNIEHIILNFQNYSFIKYLPILEVYKRYSNIVGGQNRDFYLRIVEIVFIFPFLKKLKKYDKNVNFYYCMLIIACIINFFGYYNIFIKRIYLFFEIYIIFIINDFVRFLKNQYGINISLFVYIIAMLYFYLYYFMLGNSGIFPYRINL